MTNSGEGQISILARAQCRVRPAFAVRAPAIAGMIAATVALGVNVSWGTPGVAKITSSVIMRGSSVAGLGRAAASVSWSLPAAAGPGLLILLAECPARRFIDAAGALPSPCGDGVSA